MNVRSKLYSITVDDVVNVSDEIGIIFSTKDLDFIQDKIGDCFGDQWYEAVEYALRELEKARSGKKRELSA